LPRVKASVYKMRGKRIASPRRFRGEDMPQKDKGADRIRDIQQQLLREFEGKIAPQVVVDSVNATADTYAGVRVRDFVPLFVYRETRERLLHSPPSP
jgi:hypothetical protein